MCGEVVDQAEIHRKAVSDGTKECIAVVAQLHDNFAVLPDRETAWGDLIKLTQHKNKRLRRFALDSIAIVFHHTSDKKSTE